MPPRSRLPLPSLLPHAHPHNATSSSKPAVKQRIRAIKNIGKITKAMKMVAASKMRNAQVAVENSRGIVAPFVRLFGDHPGELRGAAACSACLCCRGSEEREAEGAAPPQRVRSV